jgi:hypothetical protein
MTNSMPPERILANLLAIIHGDGGHHAEKHGLYESAAEAIQLWYKLKTEVDNCSHQIQSACTWTESADNLYPKDTKPEGKWYARCPMIKRMGPFKSQEDAWLAMVGHDGYPVEGACVFFSSKQP